MDIGITVLETALYLFIGFGTRKLDQKANGSDLPLIVFFWPLFLIANSFLPDGKGKGDAE